MTNRRPFAKKTTVIKQQILKIHDHPVTLGMLLGQSGGSESLTHFVCELFRDFHCGETLLETFVFFPLSTLGKAAGSDLTEITKEKTHHKNEIRLDGVPGRSGGWVHSIPS